MGVAASRPQQAHCAVAREGIEEYLQTYSSINAATKDAMLGLAAECHLNAADLNMKIVDAHNKRLEHERKMREEEERAPYKIDANQMLNTVTEPTERLIRIQTDVLTNPHYRDRFCQEFRYIAHQRLENAIAGCSNDHGFGFCYAMGHDYWGFRHFASVAHECGIEDLVKRVDQAMPVMKEFKRQFYSPAKTAERELRYEVYNRINK